MISRLLSYECKSVSTNTIRDAPIDRQNWTNLTSPADLTVKNTVFSPFWMTQLNG